MFILGGFTLVSVFSVVFLNYDFSNDKKVKYEALLQPEARVAYEYKKQKYLKNMVAETNRLSNFRKKN